MAKTFFSYILFTYRTPDNEGGATVVFLRHVSIVGQSGIKRV